MEVDRQLPAGEEIFLDHIAHFVRDPAAASRALIRAGFAPAPASVQVDPDLAGGAPRPTGTGNVTAMFQRGYIELLFKTADTPLGRELEAALARYPGVHLAAFSVADAAKAHARLAAAGFPMRPLVEMERPVDTPAGPGKAAFTIARVAPGAMAEGRIQMLTHRSEERVWQRRWLAHPNTAQGLLDIVFAVNDIAEAGERFARFTARAAVANRYGAAVLLDRGRVQLLSRQALAALLPDVDAPGLPFAAAYGLSVGSLEAVAERLARGDIAHCRRGKALFAAFPSDLGLGRWVFVERAADLPWRA
jgi:hypothetical protein